MADDIIDEVDEATKAAEGSEDENEPENEGDSELEAGSEDEKGTSKAAEKRIAQLTARLRQEQREKEALKEDVTFAKRHVESFQKQIDELKERRDADDPKPAEDAPTEEHLAWYDRQLERVTEGSEKKIANLTETVAIERRKAEMRAKHTDFQEILDTYEQKFANDPALTKIVNDSSDPFQTFYDEAKKLDVDVTTQLEKEAGKQAADVGEPKKSGGTSKSAWNETMEADFKQAQRIFGKEVYPDKKAYLASRNEGAAIRNERRGERSGS